MKKMRRHPGQAMVEFAVIAPVLMLFVLLVVDVGRAYWQAIDAAGAARAGVRIGVISDTSDIGSAVRDEPNSGIPNTVAAWGNVGPGTAQGTCTNAVLTCGDPNGCQATSFTGNQVACFAVRICSLSGGDLGSCNAWGAWGARPEDGTGQGLEVLVVIKFRSVTPALAQVVGAASGGTIYIQQAVIGEELYF
jgi:TadE-like protein